jgi:hypothetical protein
VTDVIARPHLSGVKVTLGSSTVTVDVMLEYDGRPFRGSVTRGVTETKEAAAEATSIALTNATEVPVTVVGVRVFEVTGRPMCVTLVDVPAIEKFLAGSVVIEGDPAEAAVKSVLHAVNRILSHGTLRELVREQFGFA